MHTLAINGHCIALNWTNLENPNEELTQRSFYTLRAVKFSHNYCSFIVHSMIQVSVLWFHLINWWYIHVPQIRLYLSLLTLRAGVWKLPSIVPNLLWKRFSFISMDCPKVVTFFYTQAGSSWLSHGYHMVIRWIAPP